MRFSLKSKTQSLFLPVVNASLTCISAPPPETRGAFRFVTQSTTVGCSTEALVIVAVPLLFRVGTNVICSSTPTSTLVSGFTCKNFSPRVELNGHPFGGKPGNVI